jgi:two-component system response regulator HydG
VSKKKSAGGITPLAQLEKKAILDALRQSGGDKLLAARKLGIGKTTIYRKLAAFGRTKGDWGGPLKRKG